MTYSRSSHQVFYKEGALRNFANLTRKHLCQSLFLNKVAGLRQKLSTQAEVSISSTVSSIFIFIQQRHVSIVTTLVRSRLLLILPPKRIMKAKDVMDWSGFLSTWMQLFKSVLQRCCWEKFRKIHRNNSKTIIP